VEHTFFIGTLISMRSEIVTLRLNQVSRQDCGTVAVVVGDSRCEGWYRDTVLYRISNHITQRLLVFISDIFEVRCQQQVSNRWVLRIGISDFLQELGTNDAAFTEDLRDLASLSCSG